MIPPVAALALDPQSPHDLVAALVVVQLAAPAAALAAIGVPPLVGRPLAERTVTRCVATAFATAFLAAVTL
jgi:hypothetical protein